MPVKLLGRVPEVGIARDVVAIKDTTSLVSADLHRHRLPKMRLRRLREAIEGRRAHDQRGPRR